MGFSYFFGKCLPTTALHLAKYLGPPIALRVEDIFMSLYPATHTQVVVTQLSREISHPLWLILMKCLSS